MNLRERIADWISGGMVMRGIMAGPHIDAAERELGQARYALQSIIAQEKPTSNATVKRMARIAREALE